MAENRKRFLSLLLTVEELPTEREHLFLQRRDVWRNKEYEQYDSRSSSGNF
jgi:hypothetical protein